MPTSCNRVVAKDATYVSLNSENDELKEDPAVGRHVADPLRRISDF
jgi:hypothetical protein